MKNNQFHSMKKIYVALALLCFLPSLGKAAVGISTPSVVSGELIRASDWNKVKLDLETLAAAVGVLQNSTWGSSGADTYYNVGNVGIGKTSPVATLDLFATTPTANAVLFQIGTTDDTDRFRIDEDGDVTLDGKLVVRDSDIYETAGDLELSGEDSLYLSMDWNNNDGDTQTMYFGKNSAGAGAGFVELMRLQEDGDVGIGTATPASKLQVAGAIQVGADATACAAGKAGAMRYAGGAIERCNGTNWDALATTNVSDNMGSHVATQNVDLDTFKLVGNGGTSGLQIDATGRVGIGITPGYDFQVSGQYINLTHINAAAAGFSISDADGLQWALQKQATADPSLRISRYANGAFQANSIDVQYDGDVIFNDKNIGIGTSTPAALLQVYKTTPNANQVVFQVGTDGDANRFSVDEDGDVFNDGNYYVGGGNVISNAGSVTIGGEDNLYLATDWNDNDAESRSILFGKNGVGGGVGWTELMRINENGKVGIGVITPANKLHVVENISTDRVATFENPATTGSPEGVLVLTGQGAGPAPAFAVGTGTEATHTNKFVVTNAGNVGIGNTNPADKLQVEGNIYLGTTSRTLYQGGSANLTVQSNTGNVILATDAGTSRLTVEASTGNVGIGTTSPLAILHTVGPAGRPTGLAEFDTASTAQFQSDSSNTGSLYIAEGPSTGDQILQSTDGTTNSSVAGDILLNPYGGNVGIGTTSPGAKLDVVSASTSALKIRTTAGSGQDAYLEITGARTTGLTNDLASVRFVNKDGAPFEGARIALRNGDATNSTALGDLVFLTNVGNGDSLTEKMRILDNGNVGIGTASPNVKLEVSGETRLTGVSADGTGKVVCIKADSNLGTCTDAPNGSGVCTCS